MSETSERPAKPTPPPVDASAIPDELRDRDQWVAWRYEWKPDRGDAGEWDKPPINVETGGYARSTDPSTWADFTTALAAYQANGYDGLGFVVTDEDPIIGIDLDDCRDAETGAIDAWAREAVEHLDTFAEVSPSGTGLRGFGIGSVPDGGNRGDIPDAEGHVELYDTGRYLTVTGQHLDATPTDIRPVDEPVADLHSRYIADETEGETADIDETPGEAPESKGFGYPGSDAELIDAAKDASNGEKFRRLWAGTTAGYPSQSEADLALCDMLAFWTGPDAHRIDRLFRQSGLYREKWDRDDYRERTLGKALDGRSDFYEPRGRPQRPRGDTDGFDVHGAFFDACEAYEIDPDRVQSFTREGEKVFVGVDSLVADRDVADAIFRFTEKANVPSGTEKQAVIGHVVLAHLRDMGEFFTTPQGRLYYFDETDSRVYRVDGDGRRDFSQDFQGLLNERYNLLSGRFSRNLGKDIKVSARRDAPERDIYRLAHYDEKSGELFVTDFEHGYYAVSPERVEWRPNGSDVFFLPNDRGEPYEYLDPDERPDLPEAIPGELAPWRGDGDPLMRIFGNRVNYAEHAALAPADQRKQLYVHLHTLPFIDLLTARPIMAWVGEKGSGKTVIQRSIGRFIYGSRFAESAMPDAKDDFVAKVSNQALAFIDNYDEAVDWANDILAAIATGAGIDKRELFTTNTLRQEIPRCWLSITSRDPPFRRDDVADRTLVFRVERLDTERAEFAGMNDYLRQASDYRNLLWSTYLDNLRRVLAAYHETDTGTMSSPHRMADWAIFARVVGDALDVEGIDDLLDVMETERATFALENEQWARVLGRWIKDEPDAATQWHSAADLAEALAECADEHGLPFGLGSAQGIGSKFAHYHTELAELYGLDIDDTGRTNRYRFDVPDSGYNAGLEGWI